MNHQWLIREEALIHEITSASGDGPFLWYIGQMGMIIKYRGRICCVDPVLNDLKDANGHTRRNYQPPFPPEALSFADYILCTHDHADHLNLETLIPASKASSSARFIVPMPHVGKLTGAGIPGYRVIGARAYEAIELGPVSVLPLPSAHEDYETDSHGDHLFLGYILSFGNIRIYHAGDTIVTDTLVKDLVSRGPYDLMILPINGRDEERHSRGVVGNMDYKEAADLASVIDNAMVIPAHYDMVKGNGEDPDRFAEYMQSFYPEKNYRILQLGEMIHL